MIATFRALSPASKRLLAATFLWGLGFFVAILFLNFLFRELGFNDSQIGRAIAVPELVSVVAALGVARVADRIGYVRCLRLGSLVLAAGLIVTVVSDEQAVVLAGMALFGLGSITLLVVPSPLMAVLEPAERRSFLFAIQFAVGIFAGFLGNLVGGRVPGWVEGTLDAPVDAIRLTLLGAALCYALSLIPLLRVPEPTLEYGNGSYGGRPRLGRLGELLVPIVLIGLGAQLVVPFLNLFIEEKFGLSFASLGAAFAWAQLGVVIAALVQARLAKRLGQLGSVFFVQVLSIPLVALLGFSRTLPLVVGALFLRTALMNTVNPIYSAYLMDKTPPHLRTRMAGMENAIWSVVSVIGPVFSGELRQRMGSTRGFELLFLMMIGTYVASLAFIYIRLRPRQAVGLGPMGEEAEPVRMAQPPLA